MKVIKIDWLDETERAAVLTVSSGGYIFQVFSHPCTYKVADTIAVSLSSLDDESIFRIDPTPAMIKQVGNTFRHEIIAVVESAKTSLVAIGEIKIQLGGYLPGDIVDGDCISFRSSRLDA